MSSASPSQILTILGPTCRDDTRRALLLGQTTLNGIDYVEFEMVGVTPILHVHFLLDLPAGAYSLPVDPSPVLVHGGTRIVGVAVLGASPSGTDPKVLDVTVDQQGDFSPYLLTIGWDRDQAGAWRFVFGDLDRLFSVAPVNFRPGCPVDFDCAPGDDCPPDTLVEPALDYLARDYASFRQLLLDLAAQRIPSWTERSPADIGIALLELFAYEGDQLAYLQDAVANESYLDTARQRESAKRHAKLVDYRMHDGRNAWAFVHLAGTSAGTIPAGVQLVTRITTPMRFDRQPSVVPVPQPVAPPGTELSPIEEDDYDTDPALAQVRVFETAIESPVDPLNNELRIHTWGNEQCCLPRGLVSAHVYAVDAAGTTAVRSPLRIGDYLLLEEVLGPDTGAAADADPAHRQVVRIERIVPDPSTSTVGVDADAMHDLLFLAALDPVTKEPKPVTVPVPVAQTLPLVQVTWRAVDALTFPLCLSSKLRDGTQVRRVSVARGNITLADHGRTIVEEHPFSPPYGGERARVRLDAGPLTMRCDPPELGCDVHDAQPAISVDVTRSSGSITTWEAVPDLLASSDIDPRFVADVDIQGRPVLRFGDGEYGQRLVDAALIAATYRIGNGRAGNIGAEGLAHIVVPFPKPGWPASITLVRNPLPAQGGVDAETIEQTRQYAPAAFRATQFRAVTEEDYRKAALTAEGVAGAVASFRWTGSWYTVFVGIDPIDPEDLVTDARGQTRLAPVFRQSVIDVLDRYRLAGYDLEVRAARYVPLEVAIRICVRIGFFRGDVARAVVLALRGGGMPTGALGSPTGALGLFDPLNLTFAQPVYLSQIYAAVEAVEGVESAEVIDFHRHGRLPAGELDQGYIPIGAWEIAQLDNDPSRMENGTLTVTAAGGS